MPPKNPVTLHSLLSSTVTNRPQPPFVSFKFWLCFSLYFLSLADTTPHHTRFDGLFMLFRFEKFSSSLRWSLGIVGYEHLRETNFGVGAGNFFRSTRSPAGRRIQWLPIELIFPPCVVFWYTRFAGIMSFSPLLIGVVACDCHFFSSSALLLYVAVVHGSWTKNLAAKTTIRVGKRQCKLELTKQDNNFCFWSLRFKNRFVMWIGGRLVWGICTFRP